MKIVFSVLALLGACAAEPLSRDPAIATSPGISEDAQILIAPVAQAVEAEKARQAALPPPVDEREELVRMARLDQVGRAILQTIDLSSLPDLERNMASSRMWTPIEAVDRENQARLLEMVPPEGWFLKSRWGPEAASAAFLIVQHGDLEMWRRFVPVLEPLVAQGEVDGQQYGLMYDRLADHEGRPQRYGTQMTCRNGRYVIDYENLEDPETADARRATMGFRQTLDEYETNFAGFPPCS